MLFVLSGLSLYYYFRLQMGHASAARSRSRSWAERTLVPERTFPPLTALPCPTCYSQPQVTHLQRDVDL